MPYSYGCLALKYWCAESENKGQRKRLLHILQRPSEDYAPLSSSMSFSTQITALSAVRSLDVARSTPIT